VDLPNSGQPQSLKQKGKNNAQRSEREKPHGPKIRMAELWKTISVTRFFKKLLAQIIY